MQSVKCGRCKQHHTGETYTEARDKVRECYGLGSSQVWEGAESTTEVVEPDPEPEVREVPADGFYTVVFANEDDYVTLRVYTQDEDEDFMPGRTLVGFLMGPDNTNPLAYNTFGHFWENTNQPYVWKRFQSDTRLSDALDVLSGDPSAAREAYAMRSSRCARCNRPLTVPASVHRGVGPTCAERLAA